MSVCTKNSSVMAGGIHQSPKCSLVVTSHMAVGSGMGSVRAQPTLPCQSPQTASRSCNVMSDALSKTLIGRH